MSLDGKAQLTGKEVASAGSSGKDGASPPEGCGAAIAEQATTSVRLRPANEADWPTIERWLRRPDVADWMGGANTAAAEIRIVFETPSAVARIIEWDGAPVGYAHAIDATHWGNELPQGMPPGTYEIDCVIAEPSARGRGLGPVAVKRLVEEVYATRLCLACAIFVPVRNEPVVRAYEKAGFRWLKVFDDPASGPCWLMLRERPSAR